MDPLIVEGRTAEFLREKSGSALAVLVANKAAVLAIINRAAIFGSEGADPRCSIVCGRQRMMIAMPCAVYVQVPRRLACQALTCGFSITRRPTWKGSSKAFWTEAPENFLFLRVSPPS